MKKFLKNNWGKIALLTILITISFLSFKVGYSYISNDNYSPELNPMLTIERSIISPAWRSYRALGFASESEQADVFRSVFYYVLDTILPTWSLSQIFALLCLGVGSWFTGLFTSNLVKDFGKKKYSELSFLLAGIFYISTLWTVWVYYLNMFPYISQFGFLPLLIWSVYRMNKDFNWKNALILTISSIIFTSTNVIATLFVVNIILISFLALIFSTFHTKGLKEITKKIFLTILLFLSTQLFWILPFVHYTVNISGDLVDSYVNRSITSSIIDLEKEQLDAVNSARMYTRILETTDIEDEYIFPYAEDYVVYDFYKFIGLLPSILTIIGAIFLISKKKWKYLLITLITVVSWFIIKNLNPPLGFFYAFLQDSIPLFKQVFRWPSSKIGQTYVFFLSISSTLGLIYILQFITSFINNKIIKKIFWIVPIVLVFSFQLLFIQYTFEGKLFVERAIVNVPEEYYQLSEYLKSNNPAGRVLYLPTANSDYFREYEWGFVGSGFLHYIIPNPLMDMSLTIGSRYSEGAMLRLKNLEMSNNLNNVKEFMNQYEISYVLIDKNLVKGRYGYDINWSLSKGLERDLELVWSDSNLFLYSFSSKETRLRESLDLSNNTFVRDIPKSPSIKFSEFNSNNWVINNGKLSKSFIYNGEDTALNLVSENINFNSLPSDVRIVRDEIVVTPSFPTVNDIGVGLEKRFQDSNYDYFLIENFVFTRDQFVSGVSLDISYSTFNNISGFYNNWNTEDITKFLANNGKAGDCSGVEFEEDTKVLLEGLASGFTIEGESTMPCIYSKIDIGENGLVKFEFNWEVETGTYIGYCFYSEKYSRCVNEEKFLYAPLSIGNEEIIIPRGINKYDDLTLTIYAYSPNMNFSHAVFRKILLSNNFERRKLNLLTEKKELNLGNLLLEKGNEYTVEIPILIGEKSYVYKSVEKENRVWETNSSDSKQLANVTWDGGVKHDVKGRYLTQYTTLFYADPLERYLWYWSGENISNIPSTLCLIYAEDEKCWTSDVLVDSEYSSQLNSFYTQGNNRLDFSYRSSSFSQLSENVLSDFLVMRFPKEWENIFLLPDNQILYSEYELNSINANPHCMVYSTFDILPDNSIITIPQASEYGWIAFKVKNNIPTLLKNRVVVNGWKQGWDISNIDYDSIFVIYYPNLLAYIGYIILITQVSIISIYLLKNRNGK